MASDLCAIRVTLVSDNTGASKQIPTLAALDGNGIRVFEPLLRYQLLFYDSRGLMWQTKLIEAIRLLLEYAAVNAGLWRTGFEMFEHFPSALRTGTMDAEGNDPSGLFWKSREAQARVIVQRLDAFSKWFSGKQNGYAAAPLNPLRDATRPEQIMSFLAWSHSNERSFLGHADSRSEALERGRKIGSIPITRLPTVIGGSKPRFLEEDMQRLLSDGFVRERTIVDSPYRFNLRDILIVLLMHYGGLRLSECFHIWVCDVEEHPQKRGVAWVRIGHPHLGFVKYVNPASEKVVECSKAEYLLLRHGLIPRDRVLGALNAGWKNPTLDEKWYLEVRWAPERIGRLFLTLWQLYLRQILPLNRPHPYAFVNMDGPHSGAPYKLGCFKKAYARAISRIGLSPSKRNGTTPHGHRHAYGYRLEEVGIIPQTIKNCMHHHSISSQLVYTRPEVEKMNAELTDAEARLAAGIRLSPQQIMEKISREFEQFVQLS